MLKTPVRAEMVTGTVIFMHDLAATELASTMAATAMLILVNMVAIVEAQ